MFQRPKTTQFFVSRARPSKRIRGRDHAAKSISEMKKVIVPVKSACPHPGNTSHSKEKGSAAMATWAAAMGMSLCLFETTTSAVAQTWKENLAAGAATTERNHLSVPSGQPEGHAHARACGEVNLTRSELKVEIILTAAC